MTITPQELAQRYMSAIDKDWFFHAPELYHPHTRWIKLLAEGDIDAAERTIRGIEGTYQQSES